MISWEHSRQRYKMVAVFVHVYPSDVSTRTSPVTGNGFRKLQFPRACPTQTCRLRYLHFATSGVAAFAPARGSGRNDVMRVGLARSSLSCYLHNHHCGYRTTPTHSGTSQMIVSNVGYSKIHSIMLKNVPNLSVSKSAKH